MARHQSDGRDDAELIRLCNEGDAEQATEAFAALYHRHRDYVLRVALRFVSDHDTALDVLQETFSYLLKQFPPFGEGLTLTAKLTSLLYPVAKHRAIDQLRRRNRFPTADQVDPDDLHAAEVTHTDFDALLLDLPPERREVITLRFVDGLSLKEIAALLRIPLGTVKSRLSLGIKALRESPDTRTFFDP